MADTQGVAALWVSAFFILQLECEQWKAESIGRWSKITESKLKNVNVLAWNAEPRGKLTTLIVEVFTSETPTGI
jgi:uncharacterized membrane protein